MHGQHRQSALAANGQTLLFLAGRSVRYHTMSGSLLYWLNNLSLCLLAVAAVTGLPRWNALPKALKTLAVATVLMCVTGIVQLVMWKKGINNLPVLHFYTPLEFLLLATVYIQLPFLSSVQRKRMVVLAVMGTAAIVANTLFLQGIWKFNANARTIESLILMGLSVFYLFSASGLQNEKQAATPSGFALVNAGVLIYFSASFMVFLFSNYISDFDKQTSQHIWTIHAVFYLIFSALVLGAFIQQWRTKATFSG